MKYMRFITLALQLGLLLLSIILATSSQAADITLNLKTEVRPVSMPDGTVIDMWGFFDATDTGTDWIPMTIDGLSAGDNLTINLTNNLPDPVSIVIPGQLTNFTPDTFTDASGRQRVRSFAPATAALANGSYSWTDLKAGSYIFQSGNHPAKQVQMGLYGALLVSGYAGIEYDNATVLLYSEIDPALHAPPAAAKPLNYKPKYFLVNGQPYATGQAPVPTVPAGGTQLLRFMNAGLKTHVPTILNAPYLQLIAEDGNLYPFVRKQYSALLAPGKTIDALWTPAANGTYAVFDRRNHLTSNGITGGGMYAHLSVGGIAADEVTILRTRYNANLDQLRVWADSSAAPTAVLTLAGYGDMPYVGNDNFDYRLYAEGVTGNPGTVSVTSDQGGSATQSAPYTAAPAALPDEYSIDEGATLDIPAVGVLDNDRRGGYFTANDGLTASLQTPPSNGTLTLNEDGSFSYVHDGSETLSDSFTYVANAINLNTLVISDSSSPATVLLHINPTNDNPVANPDQAATSNVAAIAVDILANDTDIDSTSLTVASIDITGTDGQVTNNGTNVTYTPSGAFTGDDVFSYVATDGTGFSNSATVTVSVTSAVNEAPVAVDDTISYPLGTPSMTFDVTLNDYDPDGAINPASVCIRLSNYPNRCDNAAPKSSKRGGSLVNNYDGTLTYTPPAGFTGSDTFNYIVQDSLGEASNRARVRINIR